MLSIDSQSFKEAHTGLKWFDHELIIIINVLHSSVLGYYLVYEILVYIFHSIGYPKLPTMVYFKSITRRNRYVGIALQMLKPVSLIGAIFGLIGSANWKLRYIILSILICSPYACYDLYLYTMSRFHLIDVDNFLLFQTLFTTTFRSLRIMATLLNIAILLYFMIYLPPNLIFSDFI